MSNLVLKEYLKMPEVDGFITTTLGERKTQFVTSLLQIATSNELLKKCSPVSILNAAITAATLNLPINQNLGFAYIVPYNSKDGVKAQFQIGYKGFIQLAQRSGLFRTISATEIYDKQIINENPLTGWEFDFKEKSNKIVGYAAYFELLNGFSKTLYLTVEQVKKHAAKYSQTYKKGSGVWKDEFDSMALKTVLKLLLSKYAPLSVEMQQAIITDQAIIKNFEADSNIDLEYVDNKKESVAELMEIEEKSRIEQIIANATRLEDIQDIPEELLSKYNLIEDFEVKYKAFIL